MSSIGKFDPTSPCLVLAPHLEYPVRNGADILIDRKWTRFSKYVPFVDIVGKDTIKRYRGGRLTESRPYKNVSVSKTRAAIETLLSRSHYLLQKYLTKDFVETARLYFSNPEYRTIVFSFVWTAAIAKEMPQLEGRLLCLETHNDELEWFRNLEKSTVNPLAKLTARFSRRWLASFLSVHGSEFLFLHVSETDRRGYLKRFPEHRNYVVPVGVDMLPDAFLLQESLPQSEKVRLIFVGSLGVKMNLDALELFEIDLYPLLKERLNEDLEVLVVGSNPSKTVTKLCVKMGWKLYPNVSDEELRQLYRTATFSILPFAYTAGSKLKLLESLVHGVPYLATSALRDQVGEIVYPSLISDDAQEWLSRLEEVRRKGISTDDKLAQIELAKRSSWSVVADQMFRSLVSD